MSIDKLSSAQKKKLVILERLKEEWDLAPKKDFTTKSSHSFYTVKAGQVIDFRSISDYV